MATTFFTIENKTNLHAGSGKSNYGVIDQLVQRDPTFQFPTIHASSLKGGIKEFFHYKKFTEMVRVFGSEKDTNGKSLHGNTQVGEYKFFDALLLTLPVRSDKRAFVHITCPAILQFLHDSLPSAHSLKTDLYNLLKGWGEMPFYGYTFNTELNNATIEDFDIKASYNPTLGPLLTERLKELFGYDVVILHNDLFTRLTNDLHLPVIARNYLENGESKNLWYEQVVPRLSRFWSMTIHPEHDSKFWDILYGEDLIQIGANGSVGYGYCSFKKIENANQG